MPNVWTCYICKCTGLGTYMEYKNHYIEHHSDLETERRPA